MLSWRRVLLEAGLLLHVFGERGRGLALPRKATGLSRETVSLGVGFESLTGLMVQGVSPRLPAPAPVPSLHHWGCSLSGTISLL